MSHPAIVAYQNEDDTFDLHYSRNGSEQYQLKDMLERYLEGEFDKSGGDMPGLLPTEVAEIAAEHQDIEVQKYELIETEAFAEDVDIEDIHRRIPDISAEMLYVVRDWQVDVFGIIPITPSILPIFAQSISLECYDRQSLNNPIGGNRSSNQQPIYALSGFDFFDMAFYDELSDRMHYSFSQYQLDIINGINNVVQGRHSSNEFDEPPQSVVDERYILEYEVTDTARLVPWSVLFIEVWPGSAVDPTYSWGYDGTQTFPRMFLNDVRLESSRRLVTELQSEVAKLRLDGLSLSALEALNQAENSGQTMFETLVKQRYQEHISEEFTPQGLLDEFGGRKI